MTPPRHWAIRLKFAIGIIQFAVCSLPISGLAADTPPQVVTAGGETFAATLESIAGDGRLSFQFNDKTKSLAADEFVRWSHPRRPGPQTLVLLDDGSQLLTAADWSGGESVGIGKDQKIIAHTELWGDLALPRSNVRGIILAQRSHSQDRQRLQEQVRASIDQQDELLLSNGDRLGGTVTKISAGTVTVTSPQGDAELPLSRLQAVIFGRDKDAKTLASAKLVVGLYDGSLLNAVTTIADKSHVEIKLPGDLQLSGGTRDDIAFLQSLDGNFVYLSDLEPADYRHVPYLTIAWPYQSDRNVLGEPLKVDGSRYLKGISMHSASRLTYRLDGKYRRFDAAVAIDDSAGSGGSVVFSVYVIRDGKPQPVFTSDIIRGGALPKDVSVDVSGAQGLMLTVDFADRGDELDHADWLDARLVR
jgi:NPCBM/NEW2 domain-containing protein